MRIAMNLKIDGHSPIPIRRQLTEQLRHVIEGGGVRSWAGTRPAAIRGAVEVLLVECSPPELDFFARELEAHLPVRVDKVLLAELPAVTRRPKQAGRWRAAVTSFCHLPQVEQLLKGQGGPGIALLAEAHPQTLQPPAQLPAR